jgi:hypothetical protein
MEALLALLRQHRREILDAWVDAALAVFPEDARQFLKSVGDPFDNPMGKRITNEIEPLFDALLEDAPKGLITNHLDRIVQITCVQDVEPTRSVSFALGLRNVIRHVLAARCAGRWSPEQFLDFEARIDGMALCAFECHAKHRQRIADIRVREAQVRVSSLLRTERGPLPQERTQGGRSP